MDQETKKGITKELSTFFLLEKEQYIGYKSEEKDFRKTVTKIWYEVCARRKDEILNDPTLKRVAVMQQTHLSMEQTVLSSIR